MTFPIRMTARRAIYTLPASLALAQTDESASAASMNERSADQITGADILTMDSEFIPGGLYFISGYQEGSQGSSGGTAMSGAVADMEASGSSGGTTGQDATMSGGTSDPGATDASGSDSAGGETAATSTDSSAEKATGTDMSTGGATSD